MSVVPGVGQSNALNEGTPPQTAQRLSITESVSSSRRGSNAMQKVYFNFELFGEKLVCEKTIDPYGIYHQVLVDVGGKKKHLCEDSCYVFNINNKIRLFTIWLVEWRWFQRFILSLIVLNSILIAIEDKRDTDNKINQIGATADSLLLALFTAECLLKIVAWGLIKEKATYLRDGWNWLDFIVVVTGLLSLVNLGGDTDLSVLRVFRVLRPLRSLTVLKEMRVLVNTVLLSIPRLANVAGTAMFILVVFGIMGINFWGGVLDRMCRLTPHPVLVDVNGSTVQSVLPAISSPQEYCWQWEVDPSQSRLCGGRYSCLPDTYCGSNYVEDQTEAFRPVFMVNGSSISGGGMGGYQWCESTLTPTDSADFNFRITRFDSLPGAALTVFQSITLEGWTDVMYLLQDSHSDWFASVYFIILIIVGSFFLLNVALAVVWDAFSSIEEENRLAAAKRVKKEAKKALRKASKDRGMGKPAAGAMSSGDRAEEKKQGFATKATAKTGSTLMVMQLMDDETAHPIITKIRHLVFSDWFVNIIMFFITANVIVMMFDSYPPPPYKISAILTVLNQIFTVVFVIEFILLHLALGPKRYWTKLVTAFDGFIVITSLLELFLANGSSVMTALRGFRLLRIFKLAKKWTSFRVLLKSIAHTVKSMGNFCILLGLMMFVFTLMGMSLFATKLRMDADGKKISDDLLAPWPRSQCPGGGYDCVPRSHFDTFLWSLITVFQILTGENWNTVMYDAVLAVGWGAVWFFIALVIFGQSVILNLFLAILMSKFEESSATIREQELARAKSRSQLSALLKERKKHAGGLPLSEALSPDCPQDDPSPRTLAVRSMIGMENHGGLASPSFEQALEASKDPIPVNVVPSEMDSDDDDNDEEDDERLPGLIRKEPTVNFADNATFHRTDESNEIIKRASKESVDPKSLHTREPWPWGHSMLLFSQSSHFRRRCIKVAKSPLFDNFIIICIVISSAFMAIDSPLQDPGSAVAIFLDIMNKLFSFIFLIEMLIKWVAMGVLFNKGAYWRNSWNVLDGVVVIVSMVDLLPLGADVSVLKTLRMLRALRPLRVISRNPNLRLVVNTLFKSMPELCNLLIVGGLFFLIFGLFGLSYFKGKFYTCQVGDPESMSLVEWQYQDRTGMLVTPMCLNRTTGDLFTANEALGGPAQCGGGVPWTRATSDTPVCVASCGSQYDRSEACPPLLTLDVYPNICTLHPESSTARRLESAEIVDSVEWRGAMERSIMPCDRCSSRYCSGAFQADDHKVNSCRDECENHPYFCTDTCGTSGVFDGGDCGTCIEACVAACVCPDYCKPVIKDAANCVEQGGQWLNMHQHFDNIAVSMMTLFEISTTEGWVDVMYAGTDATEVYGQPRRDNAELWGLFFVLFMLIGSLFILNLCVGVIVDNFNKMKAQGNSLLLTEAQQKWIELQKQLYTKKIFLELAHIKDLPMSRRKMYFFCSSSKFESFIMSCIILNTVIMGMKVFPSPSEGYETTLAVFNYLFAFVFTVEAVLKLYATRWWYFYDSWNCFDFICVVATAAGILVDLLSTITIGTLMSAIRIFRIARLFRLVRFAKGLNQLFIAFILSIPKLFNVAILLLLLLFLFTVLGVRLFAATQFSGSHDDHANFRNFYRGFMTLVRCMTGESWNEIMHSLTKGSDFFGHVLHRPCVDSYDITADNYAQLQEKCLIDNPVQCGSPVSFVFFLSYTCIITFVVLNLVIAVILEGFEDSTKSAEKDVVNKCIDVWKQFDPHFDMEIPIDSAIVFMETVNSEMMRDNPDLRKRMMKYRLERGGGTLYRSIPLKQAHFLRMQIKSNKKVHFLNAVSSALRMMMVRDDSSLMEEILSIESGKHASRETQQIAKVRDMIMSQANVSERRGSFVVHKMGPTRTSKIGRLFSPKEPCSPDEPVDDEDEEDEDEPPVESGQPGAEHLHQAYSDTHLVQHVAASKIQHSFRDSSGGGSTTTSAPVASTTSSSPAVSSTSTTGPPLGGVAYVTSENGDNMTRRDVKVEPGRASNYHVKLNAGLLNSRAVEGFGAAFTAASGVNYKKLSDENKKKLIELYFGESGIGYTMGRIPINSCDFSPYSYNFDNVSDDFNLDHFDDSLKGDVDNGMTDMIHDALATTSLKLFGSPWSPPYWMKAGNHSMVGSSNPCLKNDTRYHKAWAHYFVKWIQSYEKKNISIWGVTQQNEPEFFSNEKWEACSYDPGNQTAFIRDYLGPALNATFSDRVKLMFMDYTKDHLMKTSDAVLGDPEAAKYIYGAGIHWYTFDQVENLDGFKAKYGEKYALLGTEACTCSYDYVLFNTPWKRAARYVHGVMVDFIRGGATGWVEWNLLLDEIAAEDNRGGPNHAGNNCYAHIHIDDSNQLVIHPSYYAFGHITKFVRPGGRMVTSLEVSESKSSTIPFINTLEAIAFVNEAKTELQVIVLSSQESDVSDLVVEAELPSGDFRTIHVVDHFNIDLKHFESKIVLLFGNP
ncbi:hypothetical protein FOL47_011216 [Perkinsus chesapeaki]|uniref:Uncharacterized protein n=1 Tax=Perkinsus chesapeaki TaxID=330153 RepID=A0A7J6MNG9_PERCH|nr:hypothetical protein FOL47_011216 [Perkinsus chesapeaki]